MRVRVDATRGALGPVTLRLAAPVIASEFLVSSYGFVDLYFVGLLGRPAAHAAVACLFPLMVLNAAAFKIAAVGTVALVAQHTGARRDDAVAATVSAALAFALVFSGAVALLGGALTEFIVWPVVPRVLATGVRDPAVWAEGVRYLRVIFLGAPLFQVAAIVDAAFKGRGDTFTPMVLEGLSLAVNVLCTAALTLGLAGFPELGVTGAAIASLMARGVICVVGGGLLVSGRLGFRLPPGWVRWDRARLRHILRIGIPQGAAILMYFGAMLVVFGLVGQLGAPAVSAIGAGIRQIEYVAFTCYLGFNAAAATIVGQCLGAGNAARAAAGARVAAAGGGLIGVLATLVFACFPSALAGALVGATGDAATVAYTATYVFVVAFSQIPLGLDVTLVGVFVGAGRTMFPLWFNVIALTGRVALVWSFVAGGLGFTAVCWAITGSSILKGLLMLSAFAAGWWRPRDVAALSAPRP